MLLHNFLERICKIILIFSTLVNNFIKRRVEFHDWIFFFIHLILEKASCSQVVPVLWVVLEKPCVIILQVQFWISDKVGNPLIRGILGLTVFAHVHSHVACEKLLDFTALGNCGAGDLTLFRHFHPIIVKGCLVGWLRLQGVKARDLCVVRNILSVKDVIVIGINLPFLDFLLHLSIVELLLVCGRDARVLGWVSADTGSPANLVRLLLLDKCFHLSLNYSNI